MSELPVYICVSVRVNCAPIAYKIALPLYDVLTRLLKPDSPLGGKLRQRLRPLWVTCCRTSPYPLRP